MATTFNGTPDNDIGDFGYSFMYGNAGNDELQMSVAGYGEIYGGAGDDIVYMHPYTPGTFGLVHGGSGNDTATGGYLEDRVFGDGGNDRVDGGGGNDRVFGGKGRDAVHGGDGDDVLHGNDGSEAGEILVPTSSSDAGPPEFSAIEAGLFGGAGDDRLFGDRGKDALDGGEGNDILVGGRQADVLTGGLGEDTFRFKLKDSRPGAGHADTITDFSAGDRIDLSRIDANRDKPGNQAFHYVEDSGFSGKAGELRYADGRLRGDTDGDGKADFQVHVAGVLDLGKGDFIL